jgi:chromosome partitioning protein
LNPNYLPEWSRFAEADAAATSLGAWPEVDGRRAVALYNALGQMYAQRILEKEKNAA